MKRLELYRQLLKTILDNYSDLEPHSEDYEDCEDLLNDDNIVEACEKIKNLVTLKQNIRPILNKLTEIGGDEVSLGEEIAENVNIKLFLSHEKNNYKRNLEFHSTNINVVETELLYKDANDTYSDECWRMLECIFVDPSRATQLLTELKDHSHSNTYVITVDETALNLTHEDANNSENLYAYALASLLNNKQKLEIPSDLLLPPVDSNPIVTHFNYNKDIIYKEYYDIYDALNDWLHAGDILTAFMKMYQIVEYMIYRTQLVDIAKSGDKKQSFLRAVKSLNTKYTQNERNTIINNFTLMFNGFTLSHDEVSNSWTFVDKYFEKTRSGSHYLDDSNSQPEIDKGVARFVYDTRCALVHNKESEFHILYSNYEEYKDIVPLMKSINKIMIQKIMNIINNPTSPIHYPSQRLNLY